MVSSFKNNIVQLVKSGRESEIFRCFLCATFMSFQKASCTNENRLAKPVPVGYTSSINPLRPKSDQRHISPFDITAL